MLAEREPAAECECVCEPAAEDDVEVGDDDTVDAEDETDDGDAETLADACDDADNVGFGCFGAWFKMGNSYNLA